MPTNALYYTALPTLDYFANLCHCNFLNRHTVRNVNDTMFMLSDIIYLQFMQCFRCN